MLLYMVAFMAAPITTYLKEYNWLLRNLTNTGNNVYSGDHYSGNYRYSGLNPPDDAILFTVSGITAIADKKLKILIKKS